MKTAEARRTYKIGNSDVLVIRMRGRYMVSCAFLMDEDNPDAVMFCDALMRLEESTGWNHSPSGNNLMGGLLGDHEPTHIFVALNMQQLERYCAGDWASFNDAGDCLWQLMLQGDA